MSSLSQTGALAVSSDPPTLYPLVGVPLSRDPVVRGLVVVLLVSAIPFVLPILSEEWTQFYGRWMLETLFLCAALFAIRLRLRRVRGAEERRFWNLLTIAFGSWLVVTTVIDPLARLLLAGQPAFRDLALNLPYVVLYGSIIAALEIHPHVRANPITYSLRILDWTGTFVLLFGLLLYFVVVLGIASETSSLWASSLALFVALDCYLVLRLWHLRGLAETQEWRTIYAWLLVSTGIWALGDLSYLLMYEQLLHDPGWGTLADIVWPASFAAVIVATRSRDNEQVDASSLAIAQQALGMGPLVVYALAPLLMHVIIYRFGSPEPDLRELREVLILGIAIILAGLTVFYQRILRIENKRLAETEAATRDRLVHLAFHDELTGLPNRNLFADRLKVAMEDSRRYKSKFAVLFCDLDQFKVINDSLGHEAGDQTLIASARRLRAAVRKLDTVARLGGDEFAIILQGVHQAVDVAVLAEKLLTALGEPMMIGSKSHVLTASIGIAIYPEDGEDEEALLKHADTAMYQAKLHGRNTYRLFTQAMNDAAEERLALEQGLRSGLMQDGFTVVYQPITKISTGETIAYEALLRWNHPERGPISPVSFIDVAEQTGLIVPIGLWVLETACTWALRQETGEGAPACVAVNMSSRQFREPGFVEDIARTLEKTGLPAYRLLLEITESMALNTEATRSILNHLRGLGVRIAIDDFGTGYAALGHLQELSVDILKIDRSFVSGIEVDSVSETIVLAIVNMARALNFFVVAEGVETAAELAVIRQSQCDAVQGYYLCEPLPPVEIEARSGRADFAGWLPVAEHIVEPPA